MSDNKKDLKSRILDEIIVNYKTVLEKNFDLVKEFIRVTKSGHVDVLIKEQLIIEDKILVYLVGKLYAKEAELTELGEADRKELMNELGISENSIGSILSGLKNKGMLNTRKEGSKSYVSIKINMIESFLNSIKVTV